MLTFGVLFITFGVCKSLCSVVVNPYVSVLYFLSLGVINSYVRWL